MTRLLSLILLATWVVSVRIAPTASLTGTPTDPSGAVIPAARVQLVAVETNLERVVEAQSHGCYVRATVSDALAAQA